jgi:hypothetical protein
MTSTERPEELAPPQVYEEVGENYRYFLGWRYKIPAGYLATMGGFGYAFTQSADEDWKTVLLLAAIQLALTFWIFDLRNRDLFNVCQIAGEKLERRAKLHGAYTALNTLRYLERPTLGRWGPVLTHGGVFDVLVSLTLGFLLSLLSWRSGASLEVRFLLSLGIGLAVIAGFWCLAYRVGKLTREAVRGLRAEEEQTGSAVSYTALGVPKIELQGTRSAQAKGPDTET